MQSGLRWGNEGRVKRSAITLMITKSVEKDVEDCNVIVENSATRTVSGCKLYQKL